MAEVICRATLILGTCRNHYGNNLSVSALSFSRFDTKNRFSFLKLKNPKPLRSGFHGERIVLGSTIESAKTSFQPSNKAQTGLRIGSVQKWWEKGLQPNMREITSAQDLADSLLNCSDKLVVVDFFSPGCGGCKALHPKLCQLAEMNPEVMFLQINYEEHKSMCYSLGVHVLPFFRFYRGAHGRVCSFSCTNATIKKFKDALAKHTTERCSLFPTTGLEERELLALAANKDLNFTYTPKKPWSEPVELVPSGKEISTVNSNPSLPLPLTSSPAKESVDKKLVSTGR